MKKLIPLFLLYIFLVITFSSTTFQGDERDYLNYAIHLSQGNSPETLWWGPGYPIILLIVVFLRLPLIIAKMLNACFLFGALLYFNKTLCLYVPEKSALLGTYLLGLYPPFMRNVHLLLTESFVFLLVCGFTFHFCKLYKCSKVSWPTMLLASVYLGYLALTKVLFGYVILTGLLCSFFMYIWNRDNRHRKTVCIYFFALIVCIPYLLCTFYLTGNLFYWGTSGGMSLYWISTPNKNELGDWFSATEVQERPELISHRDFFDQISNYSEIEKDRAFKEQAIYNIVHHPTKYFNNWIANIGRLLFSYPFSYTQQKITTYFYLFPNMFIFVLLTFSVYPGVYCRKIIPYEIGALLFFVLISFGGTSLLSAYDRQFRPLVPILMFWLAWVYFYILKIEICRITNLSEV